MRENPFKNELFILLKQKKGPSLMAHDTAYPQALAPAMPGQMVSFLEQMLALSSTESAIVAKRGRGRPATFCLQHLWLALLIGILSQADGLRRIWRSMVLGPMGSFPILTVTYEAVRSRLLAAGTESLQQLFEHISAHLARLLSKEELSALPLASFAPQVVALDETTLDELKRLTGDLEKVPDKDPHLRPGKLAGLLDLRLQQWVRLQFRADVPAGCNMGILELLEGLAHGSLIVADLGYFGFPWFDYLTGQGFFWISRLKERTSYTVQQVFYQDDAHGVLDALIWLGAYRADRAAHAVRLVQYQLAGKTYSYLTNVLDPAQLSMLEIAQLYARRWDIELAFLTLKREVGLALWWGAKQEIVLIQLWLALILAQILQALRLQIAWQAGVEPFDVSMHLLVELLSTSSPAQGALVPTLVERGRFLGLIRPSRRKLIATPARELEHMCSSFEGSPPPRRARYAGRNGHGPRKPFHPRFTSHFLL
jgi:hypothetical protein